MLFAKNNQLSENVEINLQIGVVRYMVSYGLGKCLEFCFVLKKILWTDSNDNILAVNPITVVFKTLKFYEKKYIVLYSTRYLYIHSCSEIVYVWNILAVIVLNFWWKFELLSRI